MIDNSFFILLLRVTLETQVLNDWKRKGLNDEMVAVCTYDRNLINPNLNFNSEKVKINLNWHGLAGAWNGQGRVDNQLQLPLGVIQLIKVPNFANLLVAVVAKHFDGSKTRTSLSKLIYFKTRLGIWNVVQTLKITWSVLHWSNFLSRSRLTTTAKATIATATTAARAQQHHQQQQYHLQQQQQEHQQQQ